MPPSTTIWFGGDIPAMVQDEVYQEVSTTYGAALERLARSYEADPEKRRDLLQDIHLAIWRSLTRFGRECSLRTWVYRVAHNVAVSHVVKHRRASQRVLLSIEDLENTADQGDPASFLERQITRDRLYDLIQQLQPVDREVILLYLEGLDGSAIAEITGISSGNVATKIHRIKKVLTTKFLKGGSHGG